MFHGLFSYADKKYFDEETRARDFARLQIGKRITGISVTEKKLVIGLDDGTHLALVDKGQSCCENRYMHTDDPLPGFIGAALLDFEVSDGPTENKEYGDVEDSQFLKVVTSEGAFTVVSYNEHNGWYGGFDITVVPVTAEGSFIGDIPNGH